MTEEESRERIVAQQMLLARECLDDAEAAAARRRLRRFHRHPPGAGCKHAGNCPTLRRGDAGRDRIGTAYSYRERDGCCKRGQPFFRGKTSQSQAIHVVYTTVA